MQPQRTRGAGPLAVEFRQCLIDPAEGYAQALEQTPSVVGQRDVARRAMQQPDVEAVLELLHRMAQRRPGDAEPRRGGTEAQQFADRNESGEIGKFGALHDASSRQPSTAEDVAPLEARNGDGGEPPHVRQHGDEGASAFFNQPWCRADGMAPDAGQTGP